VTCFDVALLVNTTFVLHMNVIFLTVKVVIIDSLNNTTKVAYMYYTSIHCPM